MKHQLVVAGLLLCLTGCINSASELYSSSDVFNPADLRFDENVDSLSDRTIAILEENNWKITYEGTEPPIEQQRIYRGDVGTPPQTTEELAWNKTSQGLEAPYKYIQARKLTSYGVSLFVVVSKLRDLNSTLSVTATAGKKEKRQQIEQQVHNLIKQLQATAKKQDPLLDSQITLLTNSNIADLSAQKTLQL